MIDLHTHILYGIDDGSDSFEESITMLKDAKNAGFSAVFFTPHYLGKWKASKEEIEASIKLLKEKMIEEEIEINIYIGNEVFFTENTCEIIIKNKICFLNNSKYVLVELPRNTKINNLSKYIFEIVSMGFIPIIAHPERYEYVQKNPNMLIELIEAGAMFQINIPSLLGLYGKRIKKTAIILLKHKMVQFIGSDVHNTKNNSTYYKMDEALKIMNKLVDKNFIEKLFYTNPTNVVENREFCFDKPISYKKKLFGQL